MKTVFITGVASGIGKATARLFAQKGWYVGLFDIEEAPLMELYEEIGKDKACAQVLDVTQPESVKAGLDFFGEKTDEQMHLLFNNAGILYMGAFETISLEKQKKILDVNVFGVLSCTFQALRLLKNTKGAQIINMSSASAMYGIPELAVYSASKHAVRALTEALSIELEKYQIRVNDLMPPYVQTPMLTEAEVKATSLQKTDVQLQPEDIAEVVWKATQGDKIHWKVSTNLKVLDSIFWAFPFAKRRLIKASTT